MYNSGGGMSMSMIQARKERRGKRAELPDDIAKKLKSCSVLSCEEWRDLNAYTTYHCFPTGEKNQERWEIWTQLIRKAREDETWIPFRGSLVCSHHFRATDFINDPLSKRRKLNKTAIPSVFPTFTVDLEDPSYQLPEDQLGNDEGSEGAYDNNVENTTTYYYTDESSSVMTNENAEVYEETYEYEYSHDVTESIQNGDASNSSNVQYVQYDEDDDDIQIIHDDSDKINSNKMSSHSGAIHILSTSSLALPGLASSQQQQTLKTSPQAASKVILASNNATMMQNMVVQRLAPPNNPGRRKQLHQQREMTVPSEPSQSNRQQPSPPSPKTSRQEETAKALAALPFSLNPDLEIEMIDPTEDLAVARLRISELEQENKSLINMYESAMEGLKLKYENQILLLRKRMKEQERLLEMNQISLPKRARFS